jgi:hypothetical protein
MTEFRPDLRTKLRIYSEYYEFLPHPVLSGETHQIVREQATIYQLRRSLDQTLWALKVSNPGYRNAQIVQKTEYLRQFQHLPGLRTADRLCLTKAIVPELLSTHPSLEFAVLMPWILGPTWAGFMDDANRTAYYKKEDAIELALTMAHALWCLEANHVTHTDIAGDNVIVLGPRRIELIDIDGLYAYGSLVPPKPSRGWRGYQHRYLDQRGNCRPEGDRYGGAILLIEMLTWWKSLVRATIEGESFFQLGEQEQPEPLHRRLRAIRATLKEIDPSLHFLFDRAWNSADLAECPDFATWVMALLQARSRY